MTPGQPGETLPGKLVAAADLSRPDDALIKDAQVAADRAVPLFSGFKVGAALRTEGGAEPYLGWNVEDLSLVRVLHAEQAAIVAALHREEAGVRITDLAIWGDGDVPPCGACRQMISDYGPQARVLFPYRGGILITSAGQLLPLAFRIRPAR